MRRKYNVIKNFINNLEEEPAIYVGFTLISGFLLSKTFFFWGLVWLLGTVAYILYVENEI